MSLVAGREKRRVMRWVDKVTGEKKRGSGSFVGRFEGEGAAIVCNWLEDGDIEVIFPAMGEGRYAFAIDFSGSDGRVERFLSGWAGYLAPESVIKEIAGADDPVTIVCMGEHSSEVWTLAGEAVDYSAQEAIKAAERAEEARDSVLETLSKAQAFMDSFDEALRECVQVVNNYLWIGGVNTGHYLKGEDGVTPRYGSDGYWYIGDKIVGKARGEDGITPHITADGYWAIGDKKTTVRAAGRDGLDGSAIRRVLIQSVEELPDHEERGVYYYVQIGEKLYDVYAWLDNANRWVNVKETYDIATDEVHGLMKFTANALTDGALVGWKDNGDGLPSGEALVPFSSVSEPGTGKLGSSAIISFGAPIGMNANGAYYVGAATTSMYGAVKLSTPDKVDEGANVGVDDNNQLKIPKASSSAWGAVKLSTSLHVSNTSPYLTSIGVAGDDTIAFNLLSNGAIKYIHGVNGWSSSTAPGAATSSLSKDERYLGLATTEQLSQGGGRLSVNAATTEMLAGVYLASSMNQRGAYALTGDVVVNYLSEHYYDKSQVYTKQETVSKVEEAMGDYATQSWVQGNYTSKSEMQTALSKKMECQPGVCERTVWVSASEFAALRKIDPLTEYKIYAG